MSMTRARFTLATLALLGCTLPAVGQAAAGKRGSGQRAADKQDSSKRGSGEQDPGVLVTPATELRGPIKRFEPFLGTWEINGQWSDGSALWARNEYRIGLAGRFVEATTMARDGDGKPYERYHTTFAYDEGASRFMSYGFVYDGSTKVLPITVGDEGGRLTMSSQWTMGEGEAAAEIKQTVTILNEKTYRWQVWSRKQGGEWSEMMDGQWKRVR